MRRRGVGTGGGGRACPVCPACGGRRFGRTDGGNAGGGPGAPPALRCRSCGREFVMEA